MKFLVPQSNKGMVFGTKVLGIFGTLTVGVIRLYMYLYIWVVGRFKGAGEFRQPTDPSARHVQSPQEFLLIV